MIEYVKRRPTSAAITGRDVRQDLAPQDRARALAARHRRLHEAAHRLLQRGRADDAGDERRLHQRDADDQHRLLVPAPVISTSRNRRAGKESSTSTPRISSGSSERAAVAGDEPDRGARGGTRAAVASAGQPSTLRPPQSTRERTSRPRKSVAQRRVVGAAARAGCRSTRRGAWGAKNGPTSATSTHRARSMASADRAACRSGRSAAAGRSPPSQRRPQPRHEQHHEQVGDDVDRDVDRRDEHAIDCTARTSRIDDRVDELLADARDRRRGTRRR